MSISITTNSSSIVADLGKISGRAFRNVHAAVRLGGQQVERDWKANATQTAGEHGKWYPDAIKGRDAGALEYTIEPDEAMRQGAMSFELGSRNQPPHLDALRAFDGRQAAIRRLIRRAVENAI